MTQCTYGNGLEDNRSYDLQGRLISQQLADALANIIDQRTYSYDKNSNILNIDTNTEDNGYTYDRLDRLTSDSIDDNNPFTYGYDLNDNRLSRQQGTGTEELDEWIDYIDNSNRIAHIDTLQRNAILPDLPDREMVYNDAGRLYQLIEEGNLKASYIYNDMGQRTRKTIYQADGTTVDSVTIYHYDRMGMLITETNAQGNLIKDYIWQDGMIPVAQITAMDGGNAGNAGAVASEVISYLYTDHLMTNRLATDDTQQVVWRWEGEAFGNTPAEELGGVSVNLRFPGQYFDAETNLHYNHFRYYDPELGRYITSDPIGLGGGYNTYLYAYANPILNTDLLGLVSGSFGAGGSFMTGTTGVSASSGFAFDTNGNSCIYSLLCLRAGWGYAASLGGVIGGGYGNLCSGTYKIFGGSWGGGLGITGSGSLRSGGSAISVGRGFGGIGGGIFGAAEACKLTLICFNDSCECDPKNLECSCDE